MGNALIVIGGVDFTSNITVPDYTMNRVDVTDTWTDGNRRDHEYIVRQQISGEFTYKPKTVEDYHLFCKTVKDNKIASGENSGAVLASLYINNENTVVSAYVRLKFEPSDTLPFIGVKNYEGFKVTVKEV